MVGVRRLHFKVADFTDLVSLLLNRTTKQSWQYCHPCIVESL